MEVALVEFPETPVAVVEHRGPPDQEQASSARLIKWRIRNGLSPFTHQTFGVHDTDPFTIPPERHRVDFCVSYDQRVEPNDEGGICEGHPALEVCCRAALRLA